MAFNFGQLNAKITADTTDFNKNIQKSASTAKTAGDAIKNSFGGLQNTINAAKKAFGGLVAAFAVKQTFSFIDNAITKLDDIGKTARAIGITAEQLQEYRYAANRAGVETEKIDVALTKLTTKIGEAANGKGELIAYLNKYNIAIKNTDGSLRSFDAIMGDISEAVKESGSAMEANIFLAKIFGEEAGPKLYNMLKDGRKGIEEQTDAARRLGIVYSDEVVANAETARDKLDDLKEVIGFQLTNAIGENASTIARWSETVIGAFSDAVKAVNNYGIKLRQEFLNAKWEDMNRPQGMLESDAAYLKRVAEARAEIARMQQEIAELRGDTIGGPSVLDRGPVKPPDNPTNDKIETEAERKARELAALKEKERVETERLKAIATELAAVESGRQEFAKIRDKYLSDEQKQAETLTAEYAKLNELLREGIITKDEFDAVMGDRAQASVQVELDQVEMPEMDFETILTPMERLQQMTENLGTTFESAFESAIFGGGKLSDVIDGLVKDIIKMTIRAMILQPLMNALFGTPGATGAGSGGAVGAMMSSLGFGKAGGGTIQPNKLAVVGERGPELVMPNAPARVLNNHVASGIGGGSVKVEVINRGTPQQATASDVRFDARGMVVSIIMDDIRRNGPIASGMSQAFGVRRQT